ncbi:uncharacterized protein SPPG_07352 [Spizellomyces punctatus DAOM BR117]|uniref:Integral membrane bound transporter domain-containing protein n=1 Tax=Spizellomyces punctatus (strain DAOM BR117) TaxID=645134 RepID=A0A0L0H912_SPIPD|nr:uncharacterized protein SPPG_07352 [Spizellomyces punctatus DAOM BR117]KNC97429.1 hypothetical protein SPPG_07352 [Spizellomyces punctatus DAOM BR117]|eukprot:XP_016605469.1 hypothetical protein SPPG_07352 [Spizellomyces punctatus DAOM BR117]
MAFFWGYFAPHYREVSTVLQNPVNLKRLFKCVAAFYIAMLFGLIPSWIRILEPETVMAPIALLLLHPARTVGAQLEVIITGLAGAFIGVAWGLGTLAALGSYFQNYPGVDNQGFGKAVVGLGSILVFVFGATTINAKYPHLRSFCMNGCIITVLIIPAVFDMPSYQPAPILSALKGYCIGAGISLVLNIFPWPEFANEHLKSTMFDSFNKVRTCLDSEVSLFLSFPAAFIDPPTPRRRASTRDLQRRSSVSAAMATSQHLAAARSAVSEIHNARKDATHELGYGYHAPHSLRDLENYTRLMVRHLGGMASGIAGMQEVIESKDVANSGRDAVISSLRAFVTCIAPNVRDLKKCCLDALEMTPEILYRPKAQHWWIRASEEGHSDDLSATRKRLQKSLEQYDEAQKLAFSQCTPGTTTDTRTAANVEPPAKKPPTPPPRTYSAESPTHDHAKDVGTADDQSFAHSTNQLPSAHTSRNSSLSERIELVPLRTTASREGSDGDDDLIPTSSHVHWTNEFYSVCFFALSLREFAKSVLDELREADRLHRTCGNSRRVFWPRSGWMSRHGLRPTVKGKRKGSCKWKSPFTAFVDGLYTFHTLMKSPNVRFGLKSVVAVVLCGVWAFISSTRPWYITQRGYWAMFTTVVVMNPTVGATSTTAVYRMMGTVFAAVWAYLSLVIANLNAGVICAMMLPITIIGFYIALFTSRRYAGLVLLITYCTIIVMPFEPRGVPESILHLAIARTVTIFGGSAVALIVTWVLFPRLARRDVRFGVAAIMRDVAALYATQVGGLLTPPTPSSGSGKVNINTEIEHFLSKAQSRLTATRLSMTIAASEPDLDRPYDSGTFCEVADRLQALIDILAAMRDSLKAEMDDELANVLWSVAEERRNLVAALVAAFHILASCLEMAAPLPVHFPQVVPARERLQERLKTVMGNRRFSSVSALYVHAYACTTKRIVTECEGLRKALGGLLGCGTKA